MPEKIYGVSAMDEKSIKKVVDDEHIAINHMVFPKGEGLPEHYSNSNVYMIIARGKLTLQLDEQEPHAYAVGQIVSIPYHVKMNVTNQDDALLEIFVVKAPNPRNYKE